MTGVICSDCKSQAIENDEKFFRVRTTSSGRDFDLEMEDLVWCTSCFEQYVENNGVSRIQSAIRLENPMMGD